MQSKRIVAGGTEIEKQLDDLLGQDGSTGLSPGDSKVESPSVSPLTSLKSIVLSMDWEINDPILKEFIQELNRLKDVFQQDGIVVKSLQLLEALGKYILQKKARTHPDSIRLLQSIYRDLEILLLSKGIAEPVKRKVLVDQVAQFMKLKKKLALPARSVAGYLAGESEIASTSQDISFTESVSKEKTVSGNERIASLEAVLYALEDIKTYIQTEFSTLRAELKL
jgi:hypothetical protein